MKSPISPKNRAKERCTIVTTYFAVRTLVRDLSVKTLTTAMDVTDYRFLPDSDIVF
jgi:hypothetical protein